MGLMGSKTLSMNSMRVVRLCAWILCGKLDSAHEFSVGNKTLHMDSLREVRLCAGNSCVEAYSQRAIYKTFHL